MTLADYASYDGLGLAELVRTGQVTATELVEEALERIDRLDPSLNAIVHRMDDSARETARRGPGDGPFAGVPFLVKDLVQLVAGAPYRAGSRFLEGFVPDHDTELMIRFRRAGLIPIGKTSTPELGLTPYTEPELFGPCRNPWDLSRTTGGSSGGSAAAVAAGIVPIAGAGDGGGSIRIPASCCGIFGLKPTRGRTPTGPDIGELWQGAAVDLVVSRSVRDTAAILDATHGPDPGAPYQTPPPARPFLHEVATEPGRLRIAVTTEPWMGSTVHPDCEAAVADAAELLRSLGHEVVEDSLDFDGRAFARAFLVMVCAECAADVQYASEVVGRKATSADFEAATWALHLLGRALGADELSTALRAQGMASRRVGAFFERCDVLLTPTLAVPPFPIGALQPSAGERFLLELLGRIGSGRLLKWIGLLDRLAGEVFDAMPYTPIFNATGQPAMNVPLWWNRDHLPVGVQLVGRFGAEATLLRLAGQLERARPWFDRRPPLTGARR